MSFDKIHPKIVENIQQALPAGSVLVSMASLNAEASELLYKDIASGRTMTTAISKASPMIGIGSRVMRFPAANGEPLKDVIEKFAKQYKLLMVEGVDYEVGDRKVDFDGEPFYTEVIQILPGSFLLNGTLTFILVDTGAEACSDVQEVVDPKMRDAMIMFSKLFDVDGRILTGNNLSEVALDTVWEHTKTCGGLKAMTREILAKGVASPLSSDGVSDYTCLSTELGDFGIRFKSK